MKVLLGLVLVLSAAQAFTVFGPSRESTRCFSTEEPVEAEAEDLKNANIELFLEKKYPSFHNLMNDEMRKALKTDKATIFAPTEAAFEELGEKKRAQIEDPRNAEIREKMGSYHIIPGSAISAIELRTEDWTKGRPKDGSKPNTLIAGVVTQSGEVPVGREKSGGILGWGAKEDGDFIVGPSAKIVQSFNVDECVVHEMDALVSPVVLWRYCDQLRIPGF
mmetsp:Transcript_72500/g.109399  ORF Transcript_72500/g.109399 Transcript_72500/m.109399 type:complete len:220 (+) Transcript_72500:117-776(+)